MLKSILATFVRFATLCVIGLLFTRTSFAQTSKADPISVQEDPRLERTVTLSVGRAPLKSVIDQVGAQTGIRVTINEHDVSSGYLVLAECKSIKASALMHSLHSLLSLRGGEWAWTRARRTPEDSWQYTLHETPWAKDRLAIYNRLIESLLQDFIAVMRRLAPMTMAQRSMHRYELQKALHTEDTALIDSLFQNEEFWTETKFFVGALTPDQQDAVLHGSTVAVDIKSLPPDIYAHYHQSYVFFNVHTSGSDGVLYKVPEAQTVKFIPSRPNAAQKTVAPMISVTNATGAAYSWMGTGHLEAGIRDALKQLWMLPGDSAADPAGEALVKQPVFDEILAAEKQKAVDKIQAMLDLAPQDFPVRQISAQNGGPLGLTLKELARGADVPLLALLPTADNTFFRSAVGKQVQPYMTSLEGGNHKNYFFKWRDGVLLVNTPEWFVTVQEPVPASAWVQIHPDSNGHVSIKELAALFKQLTRGQFAWLASEIGLRDPVGLRDCVLLAASEPALMAVNGERVPAAILQPFGLPIELTPNADMVQARIRVDSKEGDPTLRFVQLEVYSSAQNRWLVITSYTLPTFHYR